MKVMRSKYDNFVTLALSVGSIIVIYHATKWQDPLLYMLAAVLTLYSYVVAVGLACSFSVYAIWSIIHNVRLSARLKVENMEMMKSLTITMNQIVENKNLSMVK